MNAAIGFIPRGWRLVRVGAVYAGDKYWDPKRSAWLPVTVNANANVAVYSAVIRKGER